MQELHDEGATVGTVYQLLWRMPLIYLATIIIRAACILILNPVFRLAGARMPYAACLQGYLCRLLCPVSADHTSRGRGVGSSNSHACTYACIARRTGGSDRP